METLEFKDGDGHNIRVAAIPDENMVTITERHGRGTVAVSVQLSDWGRIHDHVSKVREMYEEA